MYHRCDLAITAVGCQLASGAWGCRFIRCPLSVGQFPVVQIVRWTVYQRPFAVALMMCILRAATASLGCNIFFVTRGSVTLLAGHTHHHLVVTSTADLLQLSAVRAVSESACSTVLNAAQRCTVQRLEYAAQWC
jgi:hypothetical protein